MYGASRRTIELIRSIRVCRTPALGGKRPTAETKVIEEYLGRYICRIGISNKRLSYGVAQE